VTSEFEQLFGKFQDVRSRQETVEHRFTIADNSMAIIFKLLRIQYALSHQDEVDKQDIFLMGAKEAG